jgi:hypothetical protein
VLLQYNAAGRPLQEAYRIWAHVGHSGWQWTLDVELFRHPQEGTCWSGLYQVPASQLPNTGHIEVSSAWHLALCRQLLMSASVGAKLELPTGKLGEASRSQQGRSWTNR